MNIPSRGRPEDRARANIDRLLVGAGWSIQNRDSVNIDAARGIAIREFLLATGYGFADYLAEAIRKPHPLWTTEALWRAYETLDRSKVHSSPERVLTNIVALVKFAIGEESQLAPFPESVRQRFENWIAEQRQ